MSLYSTKRYKEKLPVCERSYISWQDCIMSRLAVFGLKFPSLLQFEEGKEDAIIHRNLKNGFVKIES